MQISSLYFMEIVVRTLGDVYVYVSNAPNSVSAAVLKKLNDCAPRRPVVVSMCIIGSKCFGGVRHLRLT